MENKEIFYIGTVNGKDYGFYLENKNLKDDWITITKEEHDELIRLNQDEGKMIKFKSGKKPIAIDYVPTETEKLQKEYNECMQYLRSTDYIALKIAEGSATKEEYSVELEKRQNARNKINEIKNN